MYSASPPRASLSRRAFPRGLAVAVAVVLALVVSLACHPRRGSAFAVAFFAVAFALAFLVVIPEGDLLSQLKLSLHLPLLLVILEGDLLLFLSWC
jgi:hypothetical protein